MISLTKTAYKKVVSHLQKRGKGVGIKLGVKTTGCSGMAYTIEFVDEYKYDTSTINYAQDDFVVLVDKKSDVYLNGLTMDWVRNGLNEGFDFINPNEKNRCGCGESFSVK